MAPMLRRRCGRCDELRRERLGFRERTKRRGGDVTETCENPFAGGSESVVIARTANGSLAQALRNYGPEYRTPWDQLVALASVAPKDATWWCVPVPKGTSINAAARKAGLP